ncbi:MAG TPA: hypothetical protein VMF88_05505 [Bacteroidota bacterium]|nr:hypothetical protein [Bacteroidota bacterium]
MKTFMIVFSGIDRDQLLEFLGTLPGHDKWFYSFENCIFENTSLNAQQLGEGIRARFGDNMRIMITPMSGAEFWGFIPAEHIPLIIK